jgi:CubicO group peptidase (beta-lactamase class C family)
MPLVRPISTLIFVISTTAAGFLAAGEPLPTTSQARAAFSEERLRRVDGYVDSLIQDQKYSALMVLLARDGKIVEWKSFGYRDRATQTPLRKDDIFAVYSLSKIVTTVGALMLVEEGKITLREPIARFLPEFAAMKVLSGGTADAPELVGAARPITLHDLLTHTAGFSDFNATNAPILAAIRKRHTNRVETLRGMARDLASYPLQYQPGEAWIYGPSTDLVGALIESVSGKPFDQYLEERVFRPLKMRDTGFEVPPEKRSRQVTFDARQEDGSLKPVPAKPRYGAWPSGGGGLYSTPADYVRFAQMLLNRGELEGTRLLSPKTIELMTQDHLHGIPKPTKIYPASDGFGYGVEIRTDLARGQWVGSAGTFGWNGASTAYCAMDPKERLITMIWSQHLPNSEFELYERFNNLVYGALIK